MSTNYAFLHGGGQGSWVWQSTITALAQQTSAAQLQTLALDVPGCGLKRGRQTDSLNIASIAEELIQDIEKRFTNNVVLIGHSQAGQAMCFMAKQRPELFKRLIYISCSIPLAGQNIQQMIGNGLQGENDKEIGWPLDPASSNINDQYTAMFCNDMDTEQTKHFLAALGQDIWPPSTYTHTDWPYEHLGDIPASYIVCLKDMSLPAAWQSTFADRFKAQRTIAIDAGHQIMLTRPHELAETLRTEANL